MAITIPAAGREASALARVYRAVAGGERGLVSGVLLHGVAETIPLLASGIGPLRLAWCIDQTGSSRAMFEFLAAVIASWACAMSSSSWSSAPHVEPGSR